jgi:hypothetical protein
MEGCCYLRVCCSFVDLISNLFNSNEFKFMKLDVWEILPLDPAVCRWRWFKFEY